MKSCYSKCERQQQLHEGLVGNAEYWAWDMARQVFLLAAKPDELSFSPRTPTQWKDRTDCHRLVSDLHMLASACAPTHIHTKSHIKILRKPWTMQNIWSRPWPINLESAVSEGCIAEWFKHWMIETMIATLPPEHSRDRVLGPCPLGGAVSPTWQEDLMEYDLIYKIRKTAVMSLRQTIQLWNAAIGSPTTTHLQWNQLHPNTENDSFWLIWKLESHMNKDLLLFRSLLPIHNGSLQFCIHQRDWRSHSVFQ